jgi:hypothetical protein
VPLFRSPSRCDPSIGSPCFFALNASHTHIVIHNSVSTHDSFNFSFLCMVRLVRSALVIFGDIRFKRNPLRNHVNLSDSCDTRPNPKYSSVKVGRASSNVSSCLMVSGLMRTWCDWADEPTGTIRGPSFGQSSNASFEPPLGCRACMACDQITLGHDFCQQP